MKYLGIDYGIKRVGISFSDDEGHVAFPDEVLENNQELLTKISEKVEMKKIDEIVIGESHTLKQEENPIMEEIQTFIKKLKSELNIPIHLEPEYYTSIQARRTLSNVGKLDASAAALILQSFLDRRSKEK